MKLAPAKKPGKPRAMLFKKKVAAEANGEVTCRNCQTTFNGKFCPGCGQAFDDHDRPFSILIYDFLGDFIAFDSRFYKTFINLVKKPGFLTNEYFEGRQVRYSPPIKVFIFTSFVFFFLLQMQTNRDLSKALESKIESGNNQKNVPTGQTLPDSLASPTVAEFDSINDNISIKIGDVETNKNLSGSLSLISAELEKKLAGTTDAKEQQKLRSYISLCHSPEQAAERVLKYVSWAFFLLLPIFALILKLFYIRRKQNYIRHLIFSIHLHSFWFLAMTLTLLLKLVFGNVNDWITFILFLICGIYFVAALKRFYHQKLPKTIVKFLGISFLYFFVLISVVAVAMMDALSLI